MSGSSPEQISLTVDLSFEPTMPTRSEPKELADVIRLMVYALRVNSVPPYRTKTILYPTFYFGYYFNNHHRLISLR